MAAEIVIDKWGEDIVKREEKITSLKNIFCGFPVELLTQINEDALR